MKKSELQQWDTTLYINDNLKLLYQAEYAMTKDEFKERFGVDYSTIVIIDGDD